MEEALARARARQVATEDPLTRFEDEVMAFHSRVRNGYRDLARSHPDRFLLINGSGSEEDVFLRLREVLSAHLDIEV